jgi:sulfur-oxidizing protein SoxA
MRPVAALLLLAGAAAAEERRSGFENMTPATQAMQRDDLANPGMLWALEGEALWSHPAGAASRSCASCHGEAAASMRGVAARYPAFDAAEGQAVDLAGRIALCQERHQLATPATRESQTALALSAFVALQSRGLPIAPPEDPRLDPVRAEGERLYRERRGQLDLSCAQCHDDNAGRRLAGSVIPQGHPTGYPLYRLEWQALGSLQRRLRGCMTGVRAEPFAFGAPDYVAIEAFLMRRAAGMPMETPAVRP